MEIKEHKTKKIEPQELESKITNKIQEIKSKLSDEDQFKDLVLEGMKVKAKESQNVKKNYDEVIEELYNKYCNKNNKDMKKENPFVKRDNNIEKGLKHIEGTVVNWPSGKYVKKNGKWVKVTDSYLKKMHKEPSSPEPSAREMLKEQVKENFTPKKNSIKTDDKMEGLKKVEKKEDGLEGKIKDLSKKMDELRETKGSFDEYDKLNSERLDLLQQVLKNDGIEFEVKNAGDKLDEILGKKKTSKDKEPKVITKQIEKELKGFYKRADKLADEWDKLIIAQLTPKDEKYKIAMAGINEDREKLVEELKNYIKEWQISEKELEEKHIRLHILDREWK